MKKINKKNGFTLIELIIVMVILGIMAAVAVPRYLDSISNAEKSAEDAVISALRSGLSQYANNSLYENGRAEWPENPFDALSEKPSGYSVEQNIANNDGEWTFVRGPVNGKGGGQITHQRADNSRYTWDYTYGILENESDDNAEIGTLGIRSILIVE
jgi:prepilin-type N-terminal cleavage/methylation domain-containing protein